MRYIDMDAWPRRVHFEFFRNWDYPHFNLCANMDVTAFYGCVKECRLSFTAATMYVIAKTANAIPEYRYRIKAERVVEYERVHPSVTILGREETFGFCTVEYAEDFSRFAIRAAKAIRNVKECASLDAQGTEDNLLYMSAIPWVSFTSFMHPMNLHPADSVPRFAWGKWFHEGDLLKMPLSVQVHHSLMDGLHVGRFYELCQDLMATPEVTLGQPGPSRIVSDVDTT